MKNLVQVAAVYKMAILIGVLFSCNALFTAIIISFMNVTWTQLDGTSKFILIVGILQNWTGTMLAFFNKTLSRVEQGKFPIDTGEGNTTMITKAAVQVSQTTVPQPIKN